MFPKDAFQAWRASDITQELFKELAQAAESAARVVLMRQDSNPTEDQFLKGYIKGLSQAIGFLPELVTDDGEPIAQDAAMDGEPSEA